VAGKQWSEIAYLSGATASLVVGWWFLGDRWLGFVPVAFMAWGDNVAGLVRSATQHQGEKQILPSVAMLLVCLTAGALFQPYWIAAAGAVAATAAERLQPTPNILWDDNWVIIAASLSTMGALMQFGGRLPG
jgi:dolichol kinase